jgi:HprK-related kinase A
MPATVDRLAPAAVRAALGSDQGLRIQTGPFVAAVRTSLPEVAESIVQLYANYPLATPQTFTDFHVSIKRPGGVGKLRNWWKPQVSFELDNNEPFNPLPGDQGFPLLEWGLNWCVYGMCNQYLILHAAVLERGGRALILPAPSGSGKSTLCAGLLFHGWRLLSDELAMICPRTGQLIANPRPVSLKNASIDVISRLVPELRFGSRVQETVKGVVAHFAAPREAVQRASETALPGWVVFPRYVAGAALALKPMERARTLLQLAQNAFNYDIFGAEGFDMLATLADRSDCYSFEYSDLYEAIALFTALADARSSPTLAS